MKPTGNYVWINGEKSGPFTTGQLKHMWQIGQLTGETPYWCDGLSDWIMLGLRVEDKILEDNYQAQKAAQAAQTSPIQIYSAPLKQGWSGDYYAFLVILTMIVPPAGFLIGLAGVFDSAKRKKAGELLVISLLWPFVAGAVFVCIAMAMGSTAGR